MPPATLPDDITGHTRLRNRRPKSLRPHFVQPKEVPVQFPTIPDRVVGVNRFARQLQEHASYQQERTEPTRRTMEKRTRKVCGAWSREILRSGVSPFVYS